MDTLLIYLLTNAIFNGSVASEILESVLPQISGNWRWDESPWKVLGFRDDEVPSLSKDDVVRAYRKMSLKYHPDRHGGSAEFIEKFYQITQAKDILSTPAGILLAIMVSRGAPGGPGVDIFQLFDPKKHVTLNDVHRLLKEYASIRIKTMPPERLELARKYAYTMLGYNPIGHAANPITSTPLNHPFAFHEDRFLFDPNSTRNEGRYRLRDPGSVSCYYRKKSTTPGVSFVMGRDKETGERVVQSIRFDKNKFDRRSAARWWRKNRGRFEKLWSWNR